MGNEDNDDGVGKVLQTEIRDGKPVMVEKPVTKVELGCGQEKEPGWMGVDKISTEEADLVFDMDHESEWPLPSNHFTHARAMDVFEHVERPLHFLEEVHRILEPGGVFELQSPHQSSQCWVDPTHKRLIGWYTVEDYATQDGRKSYYTDASFKILERRFTVGKRHILIPQRVLLPFFNRFPEIFEATFLSRLFPVGGVYHRLEAVK